MLRSPRLGSSAWGATIPHDDGTFARPGLGAGPERGEWRGSGGQAAHRLAPPGSPWMARCTRASQIAGFARRPAGRARPAPVGGPGARRRPAPASTRGPRRSRSLAARRLAAAFRSDRGGRPGPGVSTRRLGGPGRPRPGHPHPGPRPRPGDRPGLARLGPRPGGRGVRGRGQPGARGLGRRLPAGRSGRAGGPGPGDSPRSGSGSTCWPGPRGPDRGRPDPPPRGVSAGSGRTAGRSTRPGRPISTTRPPPIGSSTGQAGPGPGGPGRAGGPLGGRPSGWPGSAGRSVAWGEGSLAGSRRRWTARTVGRPVDSGRAGGPPGCRRGALAGPGSGHGPRASPLAEAGARSRSPIWHEGGIGRFRVLTVWDASTRRSRRFLDRIPLRPAAGSVIDARDSAPVCRF